MAKKPAKKVTRKPAAKKPAAKRSAKTAPRRASAGKAESASQDPITAALQRRRLAMLSR
jgi:hypothetical protein